MKRIYFILSVFLALPLRGFSLPATVKDGILASGFLNNFNTNLDQNMNILASPDFEGIVFAFVDPPNATASTPLRYPIEAFVVPGKAYPLSALKPPMKLNTMGNLTIYLDRTLGGIVHVHPGPISDTPNEFSTVLMSQQIEGGKAQLYVIDKPY